MAYTYLIGWSKQDKWYYGVRFAKDCKPEDLWVTYFTSSKQVKQYRKQNGEPDIIQIRKIFDDSNKARIWESKVINRIGALKSSRWFNMTDNTDKFYHEGPRGPFSEEHKRKLSEIKKGKKISKEHAEKLHIGRRNSKNSAEHILALKNMDRSYTQTDKFRENMRIVKTGTRASEETRRKISARDRSYMKTDAYRNRMKEVWRDKKEKTQGGIV